MEATKERDTLGRYLEGARRNRGREGVEEIVGRVAPLTLFPMIKT